MLHIEKFEVNLLQENCYVVSDETRECVIIDCGAFYPEERTAIVNYIKENNFQPVHLLVTHGHLDHNVFPWKTVLPISMTAASVISHIYIHCWIYPYGDVVKPH